MRNLKILLGLPDDTRSKIASLENLQTIKGAYVGSGVIVNVSDANGKEIAKFQIEGSQFDKSIDTLRKGIKEDLKLRLTLMEDEIRTIRNIISEPKLNGE